MNFNNLTFSCFLKFLKDIDILEKGSNLNLNVTLNSSKWQSNKSRNTSTLVTPRQTNSLNLKIKEYEAELIFNSLCGVKNVESKNEKLSFVKKCKSLEINKKIANKMNFNIFLKSFEILSQKVYPNEEKPTAVELFLKNQIEHLFSNKTLKQDFSEVYNTLKTEEIVKLFFNF
jgi:hypothetical protein